MELKDWVSDAIAILAFIGSGVSIVISYFIWHRQTRSSVYSSIMGRLFEINRLEVEKPELFERLYEEYTAKAVSQGGKGLTHYLFMVFNLYAEIHVQHNIYGLFDDRQMEVWRQRLINDFRHRIFLHGYWNAVLEQYSEEFTEEFKDFVNKALEEAERRTLADTTKKIE